MYDRYIKRGLDLVFSLLLLVILSPLLLVLCFVVRTRLGSPVLFKQERPGKDGEIFTIYKFRTMNSKKNAVGELLKDEDRMTALGKFLRKTSMDELPELVNIIRGQMSFVGPRPLLVSYLDRYNGFQRRRHDVRPGLTGYAQVSGRNAISWEEKFEYDVYYTENLSFVLDLRILVKTIIAVFARDGISQAGEATMKEFMGTDKGDGDV